MAKVGRPPLYNNCLDLAWAIEDYFQRMDEQDRPYTIAGMTYEIGFADRQALSEYQEREDFSVTVKRAKQRIEAQRSEQLLDGKGNPAGKIFDLKNNFGWVDRQEITGNAGIVVNIAIPSTGNSQVIESHDVVEPIDGGEESCAASGYVEIDS